MTLHPVRSSLVRAATSLRFGLASHSFHREIGEVLRVSEGKVVARLKGAFLGEICHLVDRGGGRRVDAQVIAVEGENVVLSPFEPVGGLSVSTSVESTGDTLRVPVGDWLIGRVVDAFGRPLDNMPAPAASKRSPVRGGDVSPIDRTVIDTVLPTGVAAIDLFNTIGEGQRMAIFGSPGAGKSTLLSMLARHCETDVVVLAMIGERGREVREFLERQMPPEVRNRCVAVVSTSDRPPMERVIAAHTALAIAEDLRERGRKVLLLFDSVTRFARALRDVGLAAGETTVRQGLTPSFYSELPRLVERAGKTDKGSITAFFTVLYENDGVNDPIADEVTSLTDGHIILDPALAAAGHYPAISVLKSKSRLMREIASRELVDDASFLRDMMAKYLEIELLVQVGEYKVGADPDCDMAIRARPMIQRLLRQQVEEAAGFVHSAYLARQTVDAIRPSQD